MRKSYIFFIVFFYVGYSLHAHKQNTHQYITQESYNLLKLYLNADIQEMLSHLHTTFPADEGGPWQLGYITRGAFREDEEDPIYNYNSGHPPQLYGDRAGTVVLSSVTLLTIIQEFFDVNWDPFVSSSHFWNSDFGDQGLTIMQARSLTSDFYLRVPNGYQKILKYANGGWDLNVNLILYNFPTQSDGSGACATQRAFVTFHYNSLQDLFINKNLYVTKVTWLTGQQTVYNNKIKFTSNYWSSLNDNTWDFFVSNIPWEILGRMCHLVQDMSVPAHVHVDEHGPFSRGDSYESFMENDRYWTGTLVANQPIGIIDPYISSNPLHFLMYTTSQIADHFGTDGPYEGDGNDNVWGDALPEEINFLSMINLASLGGQTSMKSPLDSQELITARNVLMPQAIRATAGLLYWFACETGLINRVTFKNSFNAGTIKFNQEFLQSGITKTLFNGDHHVLTAIPQSYNYYDYVWNENAPNAKSYWLKYDKNGEQIPLSNNLNITYNLTVTSQDREATYIAALRKNYKIVINHQTEFDGSQTNQYVTYIVELNSEQISVPAEKVVNGRTYYFAGWSDGNGDNPRIIQPTDNTTYTAFYKITSKSNNLTAYSNNSQRKFVRTTDGVLHNVYESMGRVWYEISTDNGATWRIMNNGSPLDNGQAKLPAIDNYGNAAAIVYQENQSGVSKIKLRTFYLSGNDYIPGITVTANDFVNGVPDDFELFTTDNNPIVGWGYNGKVLVAWERKVNVFGGPVWGIYYKYGTLGYNTNTWYYQNTLPNTDNNSYFPTLAFSDELMSPIILHVAWEQRIPGTNQSNILYYQLNEGANNTITTSNYQNSSAGNIYAVNRRPSIIPFGTGIRMSWMGATTGIFHKTVFRDRDYFRFWYFGNDVSSVSMNRTNINAGDPYVYFISFSEKGPNKFTDNTTLSVLKTLNTTGNDIQLANADRKENMYAMSYSTAAAPYSFNKSNSIGSYYNPGKVNTIQMASGRGGVLTKGEAAFYFMIGDIKVNDKQLDFVEIADTIEMKNESDLNYYMTSEPFTLDNDSRFSYAVMYGTVDSLLAASVLEKNSHVKFRVELINDQTGKPIGTFDEVIYKKGNTFSYDSKSYQVNTKGIGNKTVRLRLVTESNVEPRIALVKMYNDDAAVIAKASYGQIDYQGSMTVKEYDLSQNYPNPFNPVTTIKFSIPNSQFVILKVYDILGREAATLVNEVKQPGVYEVEFNAGGLSSGVYLYKLTAGSYTESRKMIIMK